MEIKGNYEKRNMWHKEGRKEKKMKEGEGE
jgi:hypothetical protein